MQELTLKFNLDEINIILSGLGNMPYVQVSELVVKIQTQAKEQIGQHAEN